MSEADDERLRRGEERLARAAKLDLTPSEIAEQLGKWVVGQDEAVRAVSVALHSHIHARVARVYSGMPFITPVRISPILLMGPSGCGKSQVLRAARLTGLPIYHADASQLTATGYVGDSVSDWLRNLLAMSEWHRGLASVGIMMVDELDKRAAASGGDGTAYRDVIGADAQDGLLRLLEGGIIAVETVSAENGVPHRYQVPVQTDHLLVLLAGAFQGIETLVRRRMGAKRRMGFAPGPDAESLTDQELRRHVTAADLISYGMKPELVGRIGQLIVMPPLSRDAMRHILVDVVDGPIRTAQSIAHAKGFAYEFSENLVDAIVDAAMASDLGARSLTGLVARATARAAFEVPDRLREERDPLTDPVVLLRKDSLTTGWYGLTRVPIVHAKRERAEANAQSSGDLASAEMG